ncbi:MAG: peptide-methionine (S)-S-oxide reductase MsrA [Burkholderiaceae bacterium]|jgi:peptide-methionine (S)-S-oxide reductase|nr:peptide-methionine (S)-S-oxide reductase MsrA [Burkholderiaceae bacterium]
MNAAASHAEGRPFDSRTETIVLAGGCFWCTEGIFRRVRGVLEVQPGYANSDIERPSYAQVCAADTGSAESVRLVFDPQRIGLRDLLAIFFATHDPTTLDRQGHDIGPQYRSGIYFGTPAQERVAHEAIAAVQASRRYPGPVVTEVLPLKSWWPAEQEHHDYFRRHPEQSYCAVVIAPKIDKFEREFAMARRLAD